MKKTIVCIIFVSLFVVIGISLIPPVFGPYHQQTQEPMSVSTNKSSYNYGDMVTIRGQGAQSYSISIQIISPAGEEITKVSTFKSGAGDFFTIWTIPDGLEHGTYTITASDKSQTAQTTITIGTVNPPQVAETPKSKTNIPGWIKQVAEFWISDQIDDAGFVQVIEYLVQQEIITIPYAEAPEGEAAAEIPIWIKTNAEFWVNGKTSDDEFATALEWLINNGIIRV
jgi:hypothetical protein